MIHWHEIRGHLLTTSGQRLEQLGVRDFIDIIYSYAVNHSGEAQLNGRNFFMEYIYDLKPPAERMKNVKFEVQAKSLMAEMDAMRNV